MLLGCIGDDFTGSSDIANTLAKGGMRVTQYTAIPSKPALPEVEAGIVSLKSRTIPAEDAVHQSVQAARWLLAQGCEQIFFKYCSTFDSTRQGNIGPVAEALAEMLGEDQVLVCPAFPENGRSVYQGHLFVDDRLLAESGMKDHPLTPMVDSDLRRWLGYQTRWPVKHIAYPLVHEGHEAIKAHMVKHAPAFYVADAIVDADLYQLGMAAAGQKLLTGGSGLALGLPENFRKQGKIGFADLPWHGENGRGVVLSGSCSSATRAQVARHALQQPFLELAAEDIIEGRHSPATVCEWALSCDGDPLIYSSADPDIVKAAQKRHGQAIIADVIEGFFAELAVALVASGFNRIVTAGGETSGAVVGALDIEALEIGPEIAPGVPALRDSSRPLTLALKSGNFGDEQFFQRALEVLGRD